MDGFSETDLLRLAAGVERASEHPLALAIVAAAKDRGIDVPEVTDFDSPTGKGAVGTVDGQRIFLGGARSEEHTSELQSLMRLSYAVFCLKKNRQTNTRKHDWTL